MHEEQYGQYTYWWLREQKDKRDMYISYCQGTGIKLQKSEAGHGIVTVGRMFLSIFLVFFFFSFF